MQIDFDLSTVLAAVVLLTPVLWYVKKRKGYSLVQLGFLAVFLAYLVGVAAKTFFPISFDASMRDAVGQNVWSHINLVPLVGLMWEDMRTSLLNVLLFVPFGFFLPIVLPHVRLSWLVTYGLLLSLTIELCQFVLAILSGFTLRFIDVNDVVFNVLGVGMGWLVFRAFAAVFQALLRWGHLEMNPVLDHVAVVTKINGP